MPEFAVLVTTDIPMRDWTDRRKDALLSHLAALHPSFGFDAQHRLTVRASVVDVSDVVAAVCAAVDPVEAVLSMFGGRRAVLRRALSPGVVLPGGVT